MFDVNTNPPGTYNIKLIVEVIDETQSFDTTTLTPEFGPVGVVECLVSDDGGERKRTTRTRSIDGVPVNDFRDDLPRLQ